MDRTGRCAERHNATTTGPARVIRELLVEVNGTDKPRDSFIYSNPRKSPAMSRAFVLSASMLLGDACWELTRMQGDGWR